MALDFNSMLMQLQPLRPLDFGSGQSSMERERMRLARQEFEETKRYHDEQLKQDELTRQAQAAQAALQAQREREQAAALVEAKRVEAQRAAGMEFAKAGGAMNVEQMDAMIPYLGSLGTTVEELGQVGGLPTYRIYDTAQEQARQDKAWEKGPRAIDGWDGEQNAVQSLNLMNQLGMGMPEGRGSLDTAPLTGSDQVDETGATVADRFQATLDAGGEPTREFDEPDQMGAVPGDVIDLGAMHARTLQRLNPALQAATDAYTDPTLREQAQKSAEMAAASGLPMDKALELYEKNQETHDSTYRTQMQADAQAAKFREQRDQLTVKDVSELENRGRTEGHKVATEHKLGDLRGAFRAGETILEVLEDDSDENDGMIASDLMTFQNVKGTPSDTDLMFAFGIPKGTLITQALAMIEEKIKGGMSTVQKEAVKAYIKAKTSELERAGHEFLQQGMTNANSISSPHERAAYEKTIKTSVPPFLYNQWLDTKKQRDEGAAGDPGAQPTGAVDKSAAGASLAKQAEAADLNGGVLSKLMAGESGGDPNAASDKSSAKGVFQVIDKTAKGLGYKDAADYASRPVDEQIASGLKLFKGKGLTKDSPQEDYALVLAAPNFVGKWKSRDDVVYKKGSDEHAANAPWWPADGGDITVGSISDYYFGKGKTVVKGPERKADGENPYAARTQELIQKLRAR